MKRKFFDLGTILLIWVSWVAVTQAGEIRGERAGELIRRNILLGQTQLPIDDPLAWQYGNVQVDGPEGGMLYRFVTSGEAIEWIAAQLGLEKMKIESPDQLPLEFLKDRPSWWQPERRKPKKYFYSVEKFKSGGLRQVVLVFDAASGFTYIVEHYSDMPGI